jgi:hypothetical protein
VQRLLLRRLALMCFAAAACGDLEGLGGEAPPLATISVQINGEATRPLHAALVWGAQWLAESTCTSQPATPDVAAVMQAGCRNPFAFTPDRVAAVAPVEGGAAELTLPSLPSADVMVGGLSARIAYGSIVVFEDGDGSGALELARPTRLPGSSNGPPDPGEDDLATGDVIHGASFVAMTEADTRIAFREGGFNAAAAFYPRSGCGDPLPAFSVLSAGGFSLTDAIAAGQSGKLPQQDPATCSEVPLDGAVIGVAVRPPADVREVGCLQRVSSGRIRYREPPVDAPDFAGRTLACAAVTELVVSGRADDTCKGLTHYTLRGCDAAADLACETPEWDFTATPPAWWPCGGAP